jgi:hypothetical protein
MDVGHGCSYPDLAGRDLSDEREAGLSKARARTAGAFVPLARRRLNSRLSLEKSPFPHRIPLPGLSLIVITGTCRLPCPAAPGPPLRGPGGKTLW